MIDQTKFHDPETALSYLNSAGQCGHDELDLFEIALALAAQDHPGKSVDQYRQHLNKMAYQADEKYRSFVESDGLPEGLDTEILTLRYVLSRQNGYTGDALNYDNLENADLMRVIDRRMGMPISLGIVAIALGVKMGWSIHGLNFPGHFLIRFDGMQGERRILDPHNLFEEIDAAKMRQILKDNLSEEAELSAAYYEPASNRDIALRLQNNIKYRLIDGEDYKGALYRVALMKRFAPNDHRLLFDEGGSANSRY
jgi:regulator of sirC expression with transglutaminase-like and TPR domain